MTTRVLVSVAAAVGLASMLGCANPTIVQMSQDTYFLSRADHAGIFGNAAAMKADVLREAQEFAASKGKVVVPVTLNTTPNGPGHFATVEYQFKLVEPGSPEAARSTMAPVPTTRIDSRVITTPAPAAPAPQAKPDVYGELLKLDDLRKRGVLTDAEFEAQKRKLLGS